MELKEGYYVRTKNEMIAKIISKEDVSGSLHREEIVFILDNGNRLALHSPKVIKVSHNLLGNDKEPCLIELGDYVNGEKVTSIETNGWLGFRNHDLYLSDESEIKSIVTKEMFESMSYKVKE